MCIALPTNATQRPKRSWLPLPIAMVLGGAAMIGIFFFALLLERLRPIH